LEGTGPGQPPKSKALGEKRRKRKQQREKNEEDVPDGVLGYTAAAETELISRTVWDVRDPTVENGKKVYLLTPRMVSFMIFLVMRGKVNGWFLSS